MTVLIQDIQRTLGATGQTYNLNGINCNIAIANNNNGAGVAVTIAITDADGSVYPTITIPAYTSNWIRGANAKQIVAQGNGANITLVVTTPEHEIRIEPVNVSSSQPNPFPVSQSGLWNTNQSQALAGFQRPRKLNTYWAMYRLAARPYALSNAFGAAGRKQYATIFHSVALGATKLVKIRNVYVAIESTSVASIITADLVSINTAPVTGNPAITPSRVSFAAALPEANCLALPTTPAPSEVQILSSVEWNLGVTAAGSTLNPPPPLVYNDILNPQSGREADEEIALPQMEVATSIGYAVVLDSNAIATVKAFVIIVFTEE